MFSKVLILALAAVVNCQLRINSGYYGSGLVGSGLVGSGLVGSGLVGNGLIGSGLVGSGLIGGIPVYRSSANYGGLYAANGYGYGANLGRVAGLGALRTSGAIIGGGALGYGTGALLAGGLGVAPALSTVAVGSPALSQIGLGGINAYGAGLGLTAASLGNLDIARGISVSQAGPVNAAVQTLSRTVDYRAVPYTGEAPVVQDIDVPPQESPLRINFQSKSSPLQVTQQHIPAEPGQVQVTQSEDEPQTAIHNVVRPVHQRVNEVVQPYRTLTQTVEPVIEQTHTNIAQGEGVRLTGLQSGVVGGTGVLAASGVGVAAPLVSSGVVGLGNAGLALGGYRTAVAAPAGVVGLGIGSGLYGAGLNTGLYGAGLYGTGLGLGLGARTIRTGLVGNGLIGSGIVGSGLVGTRVLNSGLLGSGIVGSGLYGTRVLNSGLYGVGLGVRSYGLGSGLALNGLSGLSGYGTTAKIARYAY